MLTVKAIGGALLLLSSLMCASKMITAERKKIERVGAYIDIISHVRNQIDLYSAPLHKIFSEIDHVTLQSLGLSVVPKVFDGFILEGDRYVGEETVKVLREFSATLGKGYREMQIKLCDRAISELEKQKRDMEGAYPSKKKTILALCLCIGGMALIALI